jgi:hypothetical protein
MDCNLSQSSTYLHCRFVQVKLEPSLQLNQVTGPMQHAILFFDVDQSYWLTFKAPLAALATRLGLASSNKISESMILSSKIVWILLFLISCCLCLNFGFYASQCFVSDTTMHPLI